MGNMEKALEELDRKVTAIKTEAGLTRCPNTLIAVINSASVTLDVGVAVSCQERMKKRIRNRLYHRVMNQSRERIVI